MHQTNQDLPKVQVNLSGCASHFIKSAEFSPVQSGVQHRTPKRGRTHAALYLITVPGAARLAVVVRVWAVRVRPGIGVVVVRWWNSQPRDLRDHELHLIHQRGDGERLRQHAVPRTQLHMRGPPQARGINRRDIRISRPQALDHLRAGQSPGQLSVGEDDIRHAFGHQRLFPGGEQADLNIRKTGEGRFEEEAKVLVVFKNP